MIDEYKTINAESKGTYSELRSKFLAFAHPVRTVDEAMSFVEYYQRKYYDARHCCWAYMLGAERETFRSNDNGEPSGTKNTIDYAKKKKIQIIVLEVKANESTLSEMR